MFADQSVMNESLLRTAVLIGGTIAASHKKHVPYPEPMNSTIFTSHQTGVLFHYAEPIQLVPSQASLTP